MKAKEVSKIEQIVFKSCLEMENKVQPLNLFIFKGKPYGIWF